MQSSCLHRLERIVRPRSPKAGWSISVAQKEHEYTVIASMASERLLLVMSKSTAVNASATCKHTSCRGTSAPESLTHLMIRLPTQPFSKLLLSRRSRLACIRSVRGCFRRAEQIIETVDIHHRGSKLFTTGGHLSQSLCIRQLSSFFETKRGSLSAT